MRSTAGRTCVDGPVLRRPPGPEVRADAHAQVGRRSDVERHAAARAHDVGARRPGRGLREVAAGREPPPCRRSERQQVVDRARAALLGPPEQHEQDLRGRLGVRQRAVAGLDGGVEALAEAAQRQAARRGHEDAAGQPDGVDDRAGQARAAAPSQRRVQERRVEARVVGDEHGVARELQERIQRRPHRPAAAQVARLDAGQAADRARQRDARVDEPLEGVRRSPGRRSGRRRSRRCGRGTAARPSSPGRRRSRPPAPSAAASPTRRRERCRRPSARPAARRPAPPRRPAGGRRPTGTRDARTSRRAASASGTGSCRSSSRWTSRSAPSSESWSPPMRTYVRTEGLQRQPVTAPVARAGQWAEPRRPRSPGVGPERPTMS